ncbi:hypothetical protein BH23PLA1_BH23PLA1_22290 [soil metagenome]
MLRSAPTLMIPFEQAVYGTFPFWQRGYDLLAWSSGCRADWLQVLRDVCQGYGERPRGAAEAGGLFALRMSDGVWMIVGPSSQGQDDRGRPGALAFHALFLAESDFRKADFHPFAFAGALRRTWGPETTTLPSGSWSVDSAGRLEAPVSERAFQIAEALGQGHRVALEAEGPIDALAEEVWRALPVRTRRRASVATWAFGNGARFDLIALPRLAGVDLDASYVDPFASSEGLPTAGSTIGEPGEVDRERQAPSPAPQRSRTWKWWACFAMIGLALLAGTFRVARWRTDRPEASTAPPIPEEPDRTGYADLDLLNDAEDRSRVVEGLVDLAERFDLVAVDRYARADDPTELMVLVADRLRYRGPWLSSAERLRLAEEPEGRQALAWDAHLRRFAPDRPLPADFDAGPLRWQLDVLAWSFHLDPDPRLSAAEVPHALAHELAIDRTIRPHPLARKYPALTPYAEFLGRLPRR